MGLPFCLVRRDVVIEGARRIALRPLRSGVRAEPLGYDHSKTVEGVAQRLNSALQAVRGMNRRDDMGRVGALAAATLEPFTLAADIEQLVE
jgi:hypothetical protein